MLRVYSTACEPVLDLVAPIEAMLPVIDNDAANLNLPTCPRDPHADSKCSNDVMCVQE